jgi:hypothetical protein
MSLLQWEMEPILWIGSMALCRCFDWPLWPDGDQPKKLPMALIWETPISVFTANRPVEPLLGL